MFILGIILILLLPFAVGTVMNFITRQKGTNQIETYLIGFFSLFLIQGIIFNLHNFAGMNFAGCCTIFSVITYVFLGLFVLIAVFGFSDYIACGFKKPNIRKDERIVYAFMLIAIAVVIVRVVMLYGFERDDLMLETVRINCLTSTVNTYNPLTARPYELGLIGSKKLVTLPLYYTYWCMTYKIGPRDLLYMVCELQGVFVVIGSCGCAMRRILKTNKKMYVYLMFVAVLLASGDYFKGAVGYRVLWNAYNGDTIASTAVLAYIIYLILDIYRLERGDYGDTSWGRRLIRVFKILLCFACTLFITAIPTGILIILLCLITMIICASVRFAREEKS